MLASGNSVSLQQAFFDSYVNVRVPYLSPQAAERLIARPTPDFALNYDPVVIERIIRETHGQPLLVQRVCQELVNRVNHELFDLEEEREARVLPEDLEAVLSDDFVRSETRYFDGIWTDQIAGRETVEAILRMLASGPATEGGLARATGLAPAEVSDALSYLKTRDLVTAGEAGRWELLIPLMRQWLQLREENGSRESS
jgi:DNA-binding transcriptional ArsR family regulator